MSTSGGCFVKITNEKYENKFLSEKYNLSKWSALSFLWVIWFMEQTGDFEKKKLVLGKAFTWSNICECQEFWKELRDFILNIIRNWSLFCSAHIYINVHLLPILLVKLDFVFQFFGFSCFYFWFFSF